MIRNRGIAVKLTLLILSSVTVILGVVLGSYYFSSTEIIEKTVRKNAGNLVLATVNRIEKVLVSIEKVPENVAFSLESFTYERGQIIELVRNVVKNNPEIYGSTISFAPYAHTETREHFAPYYYRKPGTRELAFTEVPGDYFYQDWFQIPKELNRSVWSEPYFDEGAGNIIMATYSVPF